MEGHSTYIMELEARFQRTLRLARSEELGPSGNLLCHRVVRPTALRPPRRLAAFRVPLGNAVLFWIEARTKEDLSRLTD